MNKIIFNFIIINLAHYYKLNNKIKNYRYTHKLFDFIIFQKLQKLKTEFKYHIPFLV